MNKTVYDVREVSVETERGCGALEKLLNATGYDTRLVNRFENLDEAMELFNKLETSVRWMSGYYLHECKFIEINVVDEDGEIVGGGDWQLSDFPDYVPREYEDEEVMEDGGHE